MAQLKLRVCVDGADPTVMAFDPRTLVYDACDQICQYIPQANTKSKTEKGLFLADDEYCKGVWLENKHTLEHYLLRNSDTVRYTSKLRDILIKTMDGATKRLKVDDSQTVKQLMIPICTRLGITNHEEYSLILEMEEQQRMATLKKKREHSLAKDQKKLDEMKEKLKTDDDLNWVDMSKTLREQGIDPKQPLILRRKFFFSDHNIDTRDPVQLNLLYVELRDAILHGRHPVSVKNAIEFAAIQCQVQFGDHNSKKHRSGFLDLPKFLPKEYVKSRGIEKKIFHEHGKKHLKGLSENDAKYLYVCNSRALKTYGITFFLVKEKMQGKNKLVPRLLGVKKESIVRMDEKTKEILVQWPLTNIRRWAASPNAFTLDFGDHAEKNYVCQTLEGDQISQIISGYIDIIVQKRKDIDFKPDGIDNDVEGPIEEENVSPAQAQVLQHQLGPRTGYATEENLISSRAYSGNLQNSGQPDHMYSQTQILNNKQPSQGRRYNQYIPPPESSGNLLESSSPSFRGSYSDMKSPEVF